MRKTLRLLQEALRQKDCKRSRPRRRGIARWRKIMPAWPERGSHQAAGPRTGARTAPPLQTSRRNFPAANDQNAKALASAQDRLQKQQADAQSQLDDLRKKLDAALAESDIARQRATALEADYSKLKTDSAGVATRAADVARIIPASRIWIAAATSI